MGRCRLALLAALGPAAVEASRLLGLLQGPMYLASGAAAGAAALAALVYYEVSLPSFWARRRGVEAALAASLILFAVYHVLGFLWGLALNASILPGQLAGTLLLYVTRLTGLGAAAALLASSCSGGVRYASLLLAVAPGLSPEKLVMILRGELLFPAALLSLAAAAAAAYVASRLYTPLAGFVAYVGLVVAPSYLYPLVPAAPGYVLSLATVAAASALAAYAYEARLRARGLLRARGGGGHVPIVLAASLGLALVVLIHMGVYFFVVATGSMVPSIRPGDLVVVVKAAPGDVKPGDIVAYLSEDGSIVVHRLVKTEKRGNILLMVTRGDANRASDPPWDSDRLLGRVVAVVPRVGEPLLLLYATLGGPAASAVTVAAVSAIASSLAALRSGRRGLRVPD